jgi:hypothetical protein
MKERLMVVLELEDGQAVVVSSKELMQHKEQITERLNKRLKDEEDLGHEHGFFKDLQRNNNE